MPSPIYLAYSPVVTFVDDIGGAGGTPLSAANFNGLRSDLVTYVETHYQGIANNHDIADIESWNGATPLTEAMAYQNVANAHYTLDQRISMILNTLSVLTGGAGTLTAQLATLAGLTGGNLNALATTVGTATTLATPNTVVKRDGGGGAQFIALGLAPTGATNGVAVAAPTGYTGVPILYTLNGVNKFSVDSNGNIIAATYTGGVAGNVVGSLTGNADTATDLHAGSILGANKGGTGVSSFTAGALVRAGAGTLASSTGIVAADLGAGAVTSAAILDGTIVGGDVAARSLPYGLVSDLAMSGTGASNTVTVVANGSYVNSAGLLKTITSGTTVALTPSASGNQWQAIYWGDGGTASTAVGTVGGSRDTAVIPTTAAFQPLWVFLPQNCVGVYSSQADWTAAGSPANKGYIDQRPLGGGAGGSGGGSGASDGVVVGVAGTAQATLAAQTGIATPANIVDLLAGTASGTVNGQALSGVFSGSVAVKGTASTDAALADAWQAGVSSNIIGSLSASGGSLVIVPNAGEIFATINNRPRKIAAALTSTNSLTGNGAGAYKVILDHTGAGPAPAMFTTQGVPQANQYWVANVWWTGTAYDFTYVDWAPAFPTYLPTLFVAQSFTITNVSITGTTFLPVSGYPTKAVNLPCAFSFARAYGKAWVTQPATVGDGYVNTAIDGAGMGVFGRVGGQPASTTGGHSIGGFAAALAPGAHTFAVGAQALNGAQPFTVAAADWYVELIR